MRYRNHILKPYRGEFKNSFEQNQRNVKRELARRQIHKHGTGLPDELPEWIRFRQLIEDIRFWFTASVLAILGIAVVLKLFGIG